MTLPKILPETRHNLFPRINAAWQNCADSKKSMTFGPYLFKQLMHQTFNQAGFTRKRKALKILEIAGCFMFVLAAILVYDKISALVFWVSILLFGSGGVLALRELLKPQPSSESKLLEKQNELGNFSYDEAGFTGPGPLGKFYCRWADIDTLFAYKAIWIEERFASEDPRLELFTQDQQRYVISSYTPGWPQFRLRLQEKFSSLPDNWLEIMALPAFEPNPSLLFDRQGRSQAEIERLYYPDGFGK